MTLLNVQLTEDELRTILQQLTQNDYNTNTPIINKLNCTITSYYDTIALHRKNRL